VQTFERRLGLVYDPDSANLDLDELHRTDVERCVARDLIAPASENRGLACVRVHWSELLAGVWNEVAPLLVAGRTVLLLSDPHAPELAARVALAFADAGLPPDALALVHDDSGACLEAAARDERISSFHVSGPASVVRPLERRLAARRKPEFGAGLDDTHRLHVLRNRAHVVTRDEDITSAATAVIHGAFGRGSALSGQAPHSIGRVLCHERVFSHFTAELLAQLAASRDAREPLALLERELVDDARRMYELGLDEGATPIFTAAESMGADARFHFPVVFTNVEEHMRLARVSRPAPVLRLMRCASDERAHAFAAELDSAHRGNALETEDLSGAAATSGKGLAAARAGAQDRSPGGR
jgi:acyl-CoA reductase-like NAD-dependent aldehyde dehydrogenase